MNLFPRWVARHFLFAGNAERNAPTARRAPLLQLETLEDRSCPSVQFLFDYSLDNLGFFDDPQRRVALEQAGDLIGSQLNDELAAIIPGGSNRWTAGLTHPGTGAPHHLTDLQVPANTILVFVGGRNFGGRELGVGGFGSFSTVGSESWRETVATRGQSGADASQPTDFGPWGGSLAFDTATTWFFGGIDASPGAGQQDLLSVASHELGHLLGVGIAPSWQTQVQGGRFVGFSTTALYGGSVPLDPSTSHWAPGTRSEGREPVFTPSISPGQRKQYTPLDLAALQDVGWEVSTSPTAAANGPASTSPGTQGSTSTGTMHATAVTGSSPGLGLPPETVGSFDPATGLWYLRNATSSGSPDAGVFAYGAPGWDPVVGDWDGDGQQGIGVFDPSTGTWHLRNSPDPGPANAGVFAYGGPGWVPVVGDWDGDGQVGIGVVDPSTGTWYLRNVATSGTPDAGVFAYGGPGWVPVVGDWDGDGITGIGVLDSRTGTWYLRNETSSGSPDADPFAYGAAGWVPLAGRWRGNASTSLTALDQLFANGLVQASLLQPEDRDQEEA
jgi:hypothetical protein